MRPQQPTKNQLRCEKNKQTLRPAVPSLSHTCSPNISFAAEIVTVCGKANPRPPHIQNKTLMMTSGIKPVNFIITVSLVLSVMCNCGLTFICKVLQKAFQQVRKVKKLSTVTPIQGLLSKKLKKQRVAIDQEDLRVYEVRQDV